jgi:hypothetical protein
MDSTLQQLISPGRQQGCLLVSSFKFAPQVIAAIAEYLNLSDNSEISVIADFVSSNIRCSTQYYIGKY